MAKLRLACPTLLYYFSYYTEKIISYHCVFSVVLYMHLKIPIVLKRRTFGKKIRKLITTQRLHMSARNKKRKIET